MVFPAIDASRIFKGWIGQGQILEVFQRSGHYSRSVENAGTLSHAAGELGPLGPYFPIHSGYPNNSCGFVQRATMTSVVFSPGVRILMWPLFSESIAGCYAVASVQLGKFTPAWISAGFSLVHSEESWSYWRPPLLRFYSESHLGLFGVFFGALLRSLRGK